ncbi:MAG: OadG family protein [Myxococcota bacterium]|nr:OadG family protein [Myxococcota bacterium]
MPDMSQALSILFQGLVVVFAIMWMISIVIWLTGIVFRRLEARSSKKQLAAQAKAGTSKKTV